MGSVALIALSGWSVWFVLTATVLQKGEICPGQRGRLHKTLLMLLLVSVVMVFASPWALLGGLPLAYFVFQTKTDKTRDVGPLPILWIGVVGAWVATLIALMQAPWISALYCWLVGLVWGGLCAHLMLLHARSRLQAFHRLLPISGIVVLMLSLIAFVAFLSQLSPLSLSALLIVIFTVIILQVLSTLLWCKHLFKRQLPTLPWIWAAAIGWTLSVALLVFFPLLN